MRFVVFMIFNEFNVQENKNDKRKIKIRKSTIINDKISRFCHSEYAFNLVQCYNF